MSSIIQKIFHCLCTKNYEKSENYIGNYFSESFDETEDLFKQFNGLVDFNDKSVLDIGCGYGSSCIYMGLHGAAKVVGIDIDEDRIDYANAKLHSDYPELSNVVDFRTVTNTSFEKFDILLSKDSFEHFADPEEFIKNIKQYMHQDSIFIIVFGPLWKSPYGGHITYMIKYPWAHLIFPEHVIMKERKKYRPDEDAKSFSEVKGGLNKMTLKNFKKIIRNNGLEFECIKFNVSHRYSKARLVAIANIFRHVPFCTEYFTQNIYSLIRKKKQ